jgi:hypothetical protein
MKRMVIMTVAADGLSIGADSHCRHGRSQQVVPPRQRATYTWPRSGVLWMSMSPPKPAITIRQDEPVIVA